MLFKPTLGTSLSGSLGGLTASHNAGGAYFRSRVVPTDPGTPSQVNIRAAVASLSKRWVNVLTEAQREVWNVYAANMPMLNRIGETKKISGLAQYIRSNTPVMAFVGVPIDDGPLVFTMPELNGFGITADAAAGEIDIYFDNTDEWATQANGRLFVSVSRPQNPSINYFKGPYRNVAVVSGATPVPPVSPNAGVAVPWEFAAGSKIFATGRVVTADGRLSGLLRVGTVAA